MNPPFRYVRNSRISTELFYNFEDMLVFGYTRPLAIAGNLGWALSLSLHTESGVDYLNAQITPIELDRRTHLPFKQRILLECAFCVKNETRDQWVVWQSGTEMNFGEWFGEKTLVRLDRVVAPESGFLVDRMLSMRVEIRVDAIRAYNGALMPNIYDPFEGSVKFTSERWCTDFHVGKQLIECYSPVFAEYLSATGEHEIELNESVDEHSFELFLQLIRCENLIRLCSRFPLVIHLTKAFQVESIWSEVERSLKRMESLKKVQRLIRHWRLEDLDSEMMAVIVSKFLSEETAPAVDPSPATPSYSTNSATALESDDSGSDSSTNSDSDDTSDSFDWISSDSDDESVV